MHITVVVLLAAILPINDCQSNTCVMNALRSFADCVSYCRGTNKRYYNITTNLCETIVDCKDGTVHRVFRN